MGPPWEWFGERKGWGDVKGDPKVALLYLSIQSRCKNILLASLEKGAGNVSLASGHSECGILYRQPLCE